MPGYEVDPAALRRAADQVRDTSAPADGMDLIGAVGSRQSYGRYTLYNELGRFCTTWQAAIGLLRERSLAAANELDRSADRYARSDESVAEVIGHAYPQVPR